MTELPMAKTDEDKKKAEELAKRLDLVIKEICEVFKPKAIQERLAFNLMVKSFRSELKGTIKTLDPNFTEKTLETFIKRLLWVVGLDLEITEIRIVKEEGQNDH